MIFPFWWSEVWHVVDSHKPVSHWTFIFRLRWATGFVCGYFCGSWFSVAVFICFSTAEAVLQKMDDMQKMRRRLRSRDGEEEVRHHDLHHWLLLYFYDKPGLNSLFLCSFLEFDNLLWNKEEEGHKTFSQRTRGEFRQPGEWWWL